MARFRKPFTQTTNKEADMKDPGGWRELDRLMADDTYHVTTIDDAKGIYGHPSRYCNEAGCNGAEMYLGTSFEEVRRGDLVRTVGPYQVEIAREE